MHKFMILIGGVLFTTLSFAKHDIDLNKFNKELNKNMDQVIKNNPQSYETISPGGRTPASVKPFNDKTIVKDPDKLNDLKRIEVGHPKL